MNALPLSHLDIVGAALMVVIMAACTVWQRLDVARELIVASVRMIVQLLLLGLVLKWLFSTSNPAWIALIAVVMLLVAGREIMARQKRQLKGWWRLGIGTGSMFVSSFAVAVFGLAALVQADPWYAPRYAIPILGMLLGNTMNGVALAIDRLTQTAWQQRAIIEQRLMLGEPRHQALHDIARESLRGGMIPIVNAMAVAGIVSLPGMMTGQILAGSPPTEAVKYQILIWLLIAAGAGLGMMLAVSIAARRLFDERHRLRLDRLNGPR